MYDQMHEFSDGQLQRLHDASMALLSKTGVAFNEPEALEIFKQHGKTVDGKIVRLTEADVLKALETAPSRFQLYARNSAHDRFVGGG